MSVPKVLVAIPTCHSDKWDGCKAWIGDHKDLSKRPSPAERRQAVRDTWWNKQAFDYMFFFGQGETSLPDEITLNVPDDFPHHCRKNQEMFKWAFRRGYDWVFRCDDDTYVKRLEIPTEGDQIGWGEHLGVHRNYITGGAGFWVNRKSMELIATADVGNRTHEDDLWIGQDVLHRCNRVHDPRYFPSPNHAVDIDNLPADWLTCHSCTPVIMRALCQIQTSAH